MSITVSSASGSRRVLILTPHFPPDTSAATHRMRLIGPHLSSFGWEPTILTVEESAYESKLEPELVAMLPAELSIERSSAWSTRTRRLHFGDLGIRAYRGMRRRAALLFEERGFDAVVVTIYPTYTALLGPWLKRRYLVPFVLDYQDPWVGEWGRSAGPREAGRPDLKSRLSRRLAQWLEPRVVRSADALTAVSETTYLQVFERYPHMRRPTARAIPLGGEPSDFEYVRSHPRVNPFFDRDDGDVHLCYVGTILPLGYETLRALLGALAVVRQNTPALYRRLRLHFFGTSNQSVHAQQRVMPLAKHFGVAERVSEHAQRIAYLDALTVQMDAHGILLLGSSEHHYTASKLFPALMTGRAILACYHERSSVVSIASSVASPPLLRLVTYSDDERAETKIPEIASELLALAETSAQRLGHNLVDRDALTRYSSRAMAGRLVDVLNSVVVDNESANEDLLEMQPHRVRASGTGSLG